MPPSRRIAYLHSSSYVKCCDKGFKVKSRASATHALIHGYKLTSLMAPIEPLPASKEELQLFHTQDYVEHMLSVNDLEDLEKAEESSSDYGFGYDCPLLEKQFDFVASIAGATLTAAQCLVSGDFDVAINWGGGWHHGKKDEASGFCYVNDIVLGILRLKQKFGKVLYIDLDLHHGDGVEEAFAYSSKVLTLSFHKHEIGFFPGSGSVNDIGFGKCKGYAVNVPLRDGIRDDQYCSIFKRIAGMVANTFRPDAIVCQCGADGLSEDPMASFNLTPNGLGRCIQEITSMNLPTMFLGGGGYHAANTARCWAYLTSLIIGCEISSDIPENDYFEIFGPSFQLFVTPSNRANENTDRYIEDVCNIIQENLKNIKS